MIDFEDTLDALIEDFGKSYADHGLPMLRGRIVGLLLSANRPLSLDEIAERLEVSKGPVSMNCRQLEEMGYARRKWVKNDRRDYYQLTDDFFIRNSIRFYTLHKDSYRTAEKYLKILIKKYRRATPEEKEELLPFCQRLYEMWRFYERVLEFYRRFIDEWPAYLSGLPTFEEYLASTNGKKEEIPVSS
ncbi:MAG: MarR family transcriptional regulator [Calditrichaeota bacterium]|nr:MAG: MarR family transcriptional regulator [Calditrichota bacterium]